MTIDRPLTIAVILFVILLLVFFLVYPEYKTFKGLQMQLGETIAKFNAEYDYYSAIDKTYFDLQSRQDEIKKIDDALPQGQAPILSEIVYFLQKTAKENGLVINNLFLSKSFSSASGSNTGKDVKDIIFTMDMSGNYAPLKNFIVSLENSSRVFEVTNISFSSATDPPYAFSLQIKTYSY